MLESIIVIGVIALDQLAKYLSDIYLNPLGTSIPLIEGVFHFTSTHNTGAAFGMLAGGRWVLLIIASVAVVAVVYMLIKMRKRMHVIMRVCFSLILAGALGNLLDRCILGYVRDMFEFRFVNFAIFNVADSALTIGAVMLALNVLFGKGGEFFQTKHKAAIEGPALEGEEKAASEALFAGDVEEADEETRLIESEAAADENAESEAPPAEDESERTIHENSEGEKGACVEDKSGKL